MDTLASRLDTAMKAKGVKIPALVKVTGMTYQGIKKILDGKTASIQADNLFSMAAHLCVAPHWLATGEGPMEITPGDMSGSASIRLMATGTLTSNVTELDPQRTRVPLISWIQAGELSEVVDLFHPGEAVQWEDAFKSTPSRYSYALLVEGDSMVNTSGVHSFPPGTVLIVDPERASNAGDFVIAKDVQTQKATFKQLTTDGARWYLKPLNAQYPTIEIDDPAMRVIGRVIEAKPPSVKL